MNISKKAPTMASALKQYQRSNSAAAIDNYLPRWCGITTFTTDLNEDQYAQARGMKVWNAAINDKPEVQLSA